jgi:hypothetical protein
MLKPFRKILLTTLGVLPMLMPMDDVRASDATDSKADYLTSASELPWRKARLSLEAQTGTRNIGTLDAMLPFFGNDDFIVYADLMAKGATDNAFEGNLGLGFRRVNDAETSIFGMYAFYDVLKSVNNNQFTQVTVGAEHLGLTWDLRANAYLPIGQTKHVHSIYDTASAQIINNNIIQHYQISEEIAQMGGDVEVGRTLGTNKLRGYVAAYTFGDNLTGPRARLEYQMNSHITLNTAVQYDQTRKTQYFVGARFTVGGAKTSNSDSIYARLTDPVVRDIDVVTKAKFSNETKIATDKFWMVDQTKTTSGGTGTLDNPYASIEDAINNAPEGAIIYVKGANNTVYSAGDNTRLKQGQSIVGSVNDLFFDFEKNQAFSSKNSSNIFLMGGNGIAPTISGTLIANSHVGIYNLNLIANDLARDQAGILVDNAQNVMISDVSVSGFNVENGRAISIVGSNQVSINNLSTSDNDIGVDIKNSQVDITNTLNIDQSKTIGLQMVNSQVNVDALNITNSKQDGIVAFGGALSVKNDLTIAGGTNAIWAQAGATISANNATISNSDLLIDAAKLNINNTLTIDAKQINVVNGGTVNSNIADVTTNQMSFNQGAWSTNHSVINIDGNDAIALLLENNSQVKFETLTISNANISVQVESGSALNVTDTLTTDHNVIINNAAINVASAHVLNGDLLINGGQLSVKNVFTVTTSESETIQQISVSDGGSIIANDAVTTIAVNKVALDNGIVEIKKGSINVTGSDANGVSLLNGSQLVVNKLAANNNAHNGVLVNNSILTINDSIVSEDNGQYGINVTGGSIIAANIAAHHNVNSGIVMNGGSITTTGKVTATENGRDPDGDYKDGVIAHGLEIKNGTADFAAYDGSSNIGDGINQANGLVKISKTDLNSNSLNGYTKMGGISELFSVSITKNMGHGIFVDSADADNNNYILAKNITISGNLGKGVLLAEGRIQLETVNVDNQIRVEGDATKKRELTIDKTVAGGHISAGDFQSEADETDRAAIFVGSDAQVKISHANISDTTQGYGVWVDAGNVTLTKVVVANNKQGVIHTNGKLDIIDSIIKDNNENGIVVKDRSGKALGVGSDRILNLSNVSLMNTGKAGEAPEAGYGLAILGDAIVNFDNTNMGGYGFQISNNAEGGIYLAAGQLNLDGLNIRDNGNIGIHVASEKKSELKIYNSTIGNDPRFPDSAKQKTGIFLDSKAGSITLEGVNIFNNIESGIEFKASGSVECLSQCNVSGSKDGIRIDTDAEQVSISRMNINNNQNGIATSAKNLVLTLKEYVKINGNKDAAIHELINSDSLTIDGTGTTIISGYDNAALDLLGKKISLSDMLLQSNGEGIKLSGADNVLTLNKIKFENNGVGVLLKDINNAKVEFDGDESKIVGGQYGVKVENSTGLISIANLYSASTQRAGIYADIVNVNTRIAANNIHILSSYNNGVEINVPTKANFDLKLTNSRITNTVKHGVYITENVNNYSVGSKVFISGSNFNDNLEANIDNRSFTTLYVQSTTITGAGLNQGQRGIISSGSKDDEFVAGGAVYLDNVSIQATQYAVTSSNHLELSRTTANAPSCEGIVCKPDINNPGYKSQFRVQGEFVTGANNRFVRSYGAHMHISAGGGIGDLGGLTYTGGINVTNWLLSGKVRDHNELTINNPLGW